MLAEGAYRQPVLVQGGKLRPVNKPALRAKLVCVGAPDSLVGMDDPWIDTNDGL